MNFPGEQDSAVRIGERRECHNPYGQLCSLGEVPHHSFKSNLMARADEIDEDIPAVSLGFERSTAFLQKRIERRRLSSGSRVGIAVVSQVGIAMLPKSCGIKAVQT